MVRLRTTPSLAIPGSEVFSLIPLCIVSNTAGLPRHTLILISHMSLASVSFYLALSFRPVESPWQMGPGATEMEGHLDNQEKKEVAHTL